MTKDDFRAELAALLEKARVDPELGRNGRWVVTQLFASGCLVAKFTGAKGLAAAALAMQTIQEVFPSTLEELGELGKALKNDRDYPFSEVLCICGHQRSKHADSLEEPSSTDECKLCDCLTFEPAK